MSIKITIYCAHIMENKDKRFQIISESGKLFIQIK